jgi:hypothetical protein
MQHECLVIYPFSGHGETYLAGADWFAIAA